MIVKTALGEGLGRCGKFSVLLVLIEIYKE